MRARTRKGTPAAMARASLARHRAVAQPWSAKAFLGFAIAGYALLHGFACFSKFRYYLYRDFDLAIFVQATHGLLHGSLFSSIRGANWLGDHSSFVLFLIAPFYAVVPHPLTLLIVQTLALALGAHAVFLLARAALGREGLAVGFAVLYLLHPAVGYANLFEFHPETLATAPLLYVFYFIWVGRSAAALGCAALALLAKEDVALAVIPLGVFALMLRRRYGARLAMGLVALGLASLLVSFAVVKPMLAGGEAEYWKMYSAWGREPGEVASHLVRRPLSAVGALWSTPGDPFDTMVKRQFWVHLLLPVLGLALLSPGPLLLALPTLFAHFLSNRVQQHTIVYQYTTAIIPFVVGASVLGLRKLMMIMERQGLAHRMVRAVSVPDHAVASVVMVAALAAALTGQLLFGPFAGGHAMQAHTAPQRVWPTPDDRALRPHRDRMVAEARGAERVVVGFEWLTRFAAQAEVHSFHHVYGGTYTFSTKPYPAPHDVDAMLAHFGDQSDSAAIGRLRSLLSESHLQPVDASGDLVLFLRNAADTLPLLAPATDDAEPLRIVYDGQIAFRQARITPETLASGDLLEIETLWESVAAADREFLIHFQLYDSAGELVFQHVRYLGYAIWPVAAWEPGARKRERYRLPIPVLPAGTYAVVMFVGWRRGAEVAISVPDDPELRRAESLLQIGAIRIVPR